MMDAPLVKPEMTACDKKLVTLRPANAHAVYATRPQAAEKEARFCRVAAACHRQEQAPISPAEADDADAGVHAGHDEGQLDHLVVVLGLALLLQQKR